jgi:hypothetical protein
VHGALHRLPHGGGFGLDLDLGRHRISVADRGEAVAAVLHNGRCTMPGEGHRMSMDAHPLTPTEPYVLAVLEYGERLSYPALEVEGVPVAAGRSGWGTFVAGADQRQLVQALGILIATVHREGKA